MKIIIILFLITNILCICIFKNTVNPNQHYLSINTTLECSKDPNNEVYCEHIFNNTCPYAFEWIGYPGKSCAQSCCIDYNNYNESKIRFTCKCHFGGSIIINNTMEIFTNKTYDCQSISPSDKKYILEFFIISFSVILFIILIAVIITCCCRYIERHY